MPLVNPFWSARTQESLRLAAARPMELPRVPTDDELEEPVEPIQSGREGGAARRERSRPRGSQRERKDEPLSGDRFATPGTELQTPSSWTQPREAEMGWQSEGPLPADAAAASVNGGQEDGRSSLERDLGRLMFEQLQEENHLLRMQLEAAKRKQESGSCGDGSTPTSWSCVSKRDGQPRPPPPKTPRLQENDPQRGGSRHRFTPGGTRVPDGPPPRDEVKEQSEVLFPEWPPCLEGYAGCEIEARKSGGRMGDGSPPKWMREADRLVMSPRQARMAWLEREVWAMRDALKSESVRHGWSSYWMKPAHRWSTGESPPPAPRMRDEVFHGDRAERDQECHDARAWQHEVFHGDRAKRDQECHDARAWQHEVSRGDRAKQDQECHDDRAWQHGVQGGDRAKQDRECHDDRVWQHKAAGGDRAGQEKGDPHVNKGMVYLIEELKGKIDFKGVSLWCPSRGINMEEVMVRERGEELSYLLFLKS